MAIKASGSSLAFSEIRNEFPSAVAIGQNPCSMDEYRKLVVSKLNRTTGRYNEYVLPSGEIKFSDFYNVDRGFEVDIIIVGGGGGGGGTPPNATSAGGGGGGGGFVVINNRYFRPPFSVSGTVGRGGDPGSSAGAGSRGINGTASTFFNNTPSVVTANGGGGGGGGNAIAGAGGGCGGGAGTVTSTASGGAGNQGGRGGGSARTRNAEGGGGGGRTGDGQTAAIGGVSGSGGNGFDLNSWMGTANYRNAYGPVTTLGIAGGGGGGRTTGDPVPVTGRDGGGYGCHPLGGGGAFRDGVFRTGGGGGGAVRGVASSRPPSNIGFNGAGQGGGGVVIVRYTGSYRRDNSSGTGVEARSGTVNSVSHRFVVFGRTDTNNATFNFTYRADDDPVYAP